MANKLTQGIIEKLNEKQVEDRRITLTDFYQKGYDIIPYLEEMLTSLNEIHFQPHDYGFKSTTYARDNLVLYSLSDGKVFIYQKLQNGEYKPWP